MDQRIRHMVIFNLKNEVNSEKDDLFLQKSKAILTAIPFVENFEVFRQVSVKNDYDYGFSMEFMNQEAYQAYNNHPRHVDYVENIWNSEVARFLEIDCAAIR